MKFRLCVLGLLGIGAASSFAQPVAGYVDDFEVLGNTNFWTGGASPVQVPDGGPNGTGDGFLRLTSTGGLGAGGHMASYNDNFWVGNFQSSTVRVVRVDYKNLGLNSLKMRLVLFGSGGSRYVSSNAFTLPVGSSWGSYYYTLRQDQFTLASGSESWSDVFSLVFRFMIRHNTSVSSQGEPVNGILGLDNITMLETVPVFASAYTLVSGQPFGGDLNSLRASDDDPLYILNDESGPNAEVTIDGQVNILPGNFSQLKFIVECSATRNDLVGFVDARNFVNNTWTSLGTFTTTEPDVTRTFTTSSGLNTLIRNTSVPTVRSRVRFIPAEDLVAEDGWSERIDFVKWELVP